LERRPQIARLTCAALAILVGLAWASPSQALDKVRISAFQGAFVNLPVYVAQAFKLFEKHGIEAELIYGTGIQVTNIMVGGSADFGAFAVEHGITIIGKNQDVRLLVVNQTLPPYGLIVRNDVPTPNAGKPYPEMLKDLKGLKLGITTIGASTDITLRFLLHQVGIEPNDVKIIPVGAAGPQVAGLKNGLIDGALSAEPAQSEAVDGLKIAKLVLDIQGGQGPEIFRDYAYNGVWTTGAYLKKYPDRARAVVAAIVEAEMMINDPAHTDDVAKVATDNMPGFDPAILRNFILKYRAIFRPIATPKQIDNVETFLQGAEMISAPIPYDKIVAADFMPTQFTPPSGK
jgi:NitT/TauT family transport system substrate-binding protein